METQDIVKAIGALAARINRPLRLMEVCGTHTVAIFRHGIRGLLPENIKLLSGPGCPVCVTPEKDVDKAIESSMMPGTILATFGDMMRVPGGLRPGFNRGLCPLSPRQEAQPPAPLLPAGKGFALSGTGSRGQSPLAGPWGGAPIKIGAESPLKSLSHAKAEGADVRVVYSPLDALKIAYENPDKRVVFFATGFETTSPLVAATILEAERRGIENFYIYSAHKLVPPALRALLDSPEVGPEIKIDGFIIPGHVSTITGSAPYEFIAERYGVPSVVTGFGAEDILAGILMLLKQIEGVADPREPKPPSVEIQYRSVVRREGNPRALAIMSECFKPASAEWRGIGEIPESGLELKSKYMHRDIKRVLGIKEKRGDGGGVPASRCSCGEVLRGIIAPPECPLFGRRCAPDNPVGPCMVSEEGSCAAYYKYREAGTLKNRDVII